MISETDPAALPIPTADGSHTLRHPVLNELYHSRNGAIQESEHIFIGLGLIPKLNESPFEEVKVFEMGFGTGLNALLTWKAADERNHKVSYTGLEAYPVAHHAGKQLNYNQLLQKEGLDLLHECSWAEPHKLSRYFTFEKQEGFLHEYQSDTRFDLVYYDAFSPRSQPELWTPETFMSISRIMSPGAFLVTYSSKGSVRRALKEAGFAVEKHPGPKWKREVVRAIKK